MSTQQQPNFRPGNKALDYLISHFQPLTAKAKTVTDGLPRIAESLYRDAQDDAKRLLRQHASEIVPDSQPGLLRAAKGLVGLISGASARKEKALADCIFDLQLTSVFTELSTYTDNNEIASLLVDALVFQAIGQEAGCPREEQLMLGTQDVRGIGKFTMAHQKKPHIGDIEAWTFGKEFGAIVFGNPLDIVNIVAVSSFSLVYRVRARWHIKFLLHGTSPTKEDEAALDEMLKKQAERLQKMTADAVTSMKSP